MAGRRARASSSTGASPAVTTSTPVDLELLEEAANELQERANRPYAAALIRTFIEEQRAAAAAAE